MRVGKVKESILKRSVLKQLHNKTFASSFAPGEDAGCFLLPVNAGAAGGEKKKQKNSETLFVPAAVSVNPVEGWTLAARRAVSAAVNSFAAAGAVLQSLAPVILMPPGTEEKQLKALMKEIAALCEETGACVAAGHTAVSPYVSDLVITMTAAGYYKETPSERKISLKNMDVIAAGTAGREGAAVLAAQREKELLNRYAASFVEQAKYLFEDSFMQTAADAARDAGAVYIHDVREGGIFAGLWELAAAAKAGLDIDLKKIPIKQHTIEVCEFFHLNPYMLRSGGTLLFIGENGERIAEALRKKGISAAVIGRTTAGNDKIIRYDDEIRYLEPPKEDECYKV